MTAKAIVESCQREREPSTMLVPSNDEKKWFLRRENALTKLRMVQFCRYLGLGQGLYNFSDMERFGILQPTFFLPHYSKIIAPAKFIARGSPDYSFLAL